MTTVTSGREGATAGAQTQLHRQVAGAGARVVLVHGFTQTLASWQPVAGDLATDHEVVVVDLPGHGGSGRLEADLATTSRLLGGAGGRATYVGYSMGGRVALRLALDRPDLVERLVVLGATAGIDDADERAARRVSDDVLAARIERDGVEPFLAGWLTQPLFGGLVPTPADLAARRANTADGLASSLRQAGTATMDPPWWDDLHHIAAPTLVLAGERDHKFTALGRRLVEAIGTNARFAVIDGAGHAAHLQRPATVASSIRAFASI